uniref:Uncharacterized protein n=1 Tax=Anguilla anguilla TaxID=7936 RepID=A0A0E9TDZ0_ANGAN
MPATTQRRVIGIKTKKISM